MQTKQKGPPAQAPRDPHSASLLCPAISYISQPPSISPPTIVLATSFDYYINSSRPHNLMTVSIKLPQKKITFDDETRLFI